MAYLGYYSLIPVIRYSCGCIIKLCDHYECIHHELRPYVQYLPVLTQNHTNFVPELGYTEPLNNPFNATDQTLLNSYDESQVTLQNTGSRPEKPFQLYVLPCGNLTPNIPRRIESLKIKGLLKQTYFEDDSDSGIKNKVESLFPCLRGRSWRFLRCISTSKLGIATEPTNGWSIRELKM
ncbi:hypothetical protein C1645_826153 [Glomus cerebriforme]|uniref:Uncharacterized protein n=1 Tax=Glomus cerebriforme TaxID=658196 RepID=A0A397SVC0_9GLOM|nr:hypothetical protein C1645_826153 [Glomus cerebriforme]